MTKNRYTIPIICPQCQTNLNANSEWAPRDQFMEATDKIPELNSEYGFQIYDIDGFLWNDKTNKAFMIENKTKLRKPHDKQMKTLWKLDKTFKNSTFFEWRGTFLFRYENNGPDDGFILIHQMGNENTFGNIIAKFNKNQLFKFVELILTKEESVEQIIDIVYEEIK